MMFTDTEVAHMLVALAFALTIPGSFFGLALTFGIAKDGSPFNRNFWS
jgi:hypothetical protein